MPTPHAWLHWSTSLHWSTTLHPRRRPYRWCRRRRKALEAREQRIVDPRSRWLRWHPISQPCPSQRSISATFEPAVNARRPTQRLVALAAAEITLSATAYIAKPAQTSNPTSNVVAVASEPS